MQKQFFQIYQHLYQIYPNLPQYQTESKYIQKYQYISQRFSQIYSRQPKYFIKSPAKVTIFGDNNHYSAFSTIQCSTLVDIVVAVGTNDYNQIRINNFEKTVYPEKKFTTDISSYKFSDYDQYFNNILLSLKAFNNVAKKNSTGLQILIFCDFLGKSKLGKTTALIYGLTLAQFAANKISVKKDIFYEALNKYKASFPQLNLSQTNLYTKNNCLLANKQNIDFLEKYEFILAHSLTPEPIKSTQGKRINLRYCQIKIGIQIIKSQLGIQKQIKNLKQLQNNLEYSIEDMIDCVQQYVSNSKLSIEQIQKITDKSLIQILKQVPFANVVIDQNKYFNPYKRIMFLLKQEQIVQKVKYFLESKELNEEQRYLKFREQFRKSYINSKQLLEIQSKQIEKLIQVAVQAKIAYYKILGNGWGGNILFLVQKNKANNIIQYLLKNYYTTKQNQIYISNQFDQYLSQLVPCVGLSILDPQYQMWF